MQRFILLIFATFAFLSAPATAAGAAAEMWRVSQKSGDVRVVRPRLQPATARVDGMLAPGDVVLTGATGRATLTRGGDYIVLAPSSRLLLPANSQQGGWTRLIQEVGTMLFKVRSTGQPHFRVDTPMLAAVVKGTTFTVIVGPDRSAVQVIEGAVEVSAVQGGMSRLVEGGKTVFIANDNPASLITADGATLQKTGATTGTVKLGGSGEVGLGTVASLTDGLVRADVIVTPAKTVTAVAPLVATGASPASGAAAVVAGSTAGNVVATVATNLTTGVTALAQTAVTTPVGSVVGPVGPTVASVAPNVVEPLITAVATVATVTAPTVTTPTLTVATVAVPTVTVPTVTVPTVTDRDCPDRHRADRHRADHHRPGRDNSCGAMPWLPVND